MNRYWKVTKGFEVQTIVGYGKSNVYVGASNVLQPSYTSLRLKRGDEIHELCGGTFAVHGGKVYEIHMRQSEAFEILLHPAPASPKLPYEILRENSRPVKVKHYRDPHNPFSPGAVDLEVA